MHSNEVENHSDPLDIGADIAQRERDNQVALIQAMVKPAIKSTVCLECTGDTVNGARWCCVGCRDRWMMWNPGA
jgi:hypothetical protein